MVLASIPSPSFNTFSLGPLDVHVYGVMIAIGVAAGAVIIGRRFVAFGGTRVVSDRAFLWMVLLGFLGARIAYVSTHTARFSGRWYAVLFLWEGGLALFGGLTVGAIVAVVMVRRAGYDGWAFADAGAIGLPVAQAVGRLGNYFNQELFGTPTTLPWGLEIAPGNRPAAYLDAMTFHPTFLYEGLWNLLIVVPVILWLELRGRLARGASIGMYMVLYGTIRFLTELVRTDTTFRFIGLSRNGWVAAAVTIAGVGVVWWAQRRGKPQRPATPQPRPAEAAS